MLFLLILVLQFPIFLCSVEYVKIDIAVPVEMPEQFVHLVTGIYVDSLLVGFRFTEFLLDSPYLDAFKRFFKNLFHESGNDSALKSEEFAQVIAEVLQILLCQMVAPKIHRSERGHGMNCPDFSVMVELL